MHPTNGLPREDAPAQPRTRRRQRFLQRFSWLRAPWVGYPACLCLIGLLVLVEKIDEAFPHAPIFASTPFALASVFVALLWGIGPALLTIALGLLVLVYIFPNDIFSSDILKDINIDGPFILIQLVAVAIVVQVERSHRKLEAAYRALKAAYQELEMAQRQLERANELKNYLIARASHELRTPLTTILGRTQLLSTRLKKSGETPENWAALQSYLQVVEVRALHLRALIERLFDLSRIQAGDIPLRWHLCDLGALCRRVVTDQRNLSGRAIELELAPQPLMVRANEELLAQVLVHLLQNAIAYSPETTPIRLRLCSDEQQVSLHIHNECPELLPQHLEHLFEPFYRAPEVEYSSIPGWGLGLTICKEVVEQYGGQIWAEPSEKGGITFIVTMPMDSESEHPSAATGEET